MGALLHITEISAQNHGSLTLDLSLPWSSLLDPLPEEETPPTGWDEAPPIAATPTSLSLDAYLDLCGHHLRMSESELKLNSEIYRVIEEKGERGVGEAEIRGCGLLKPHPFGGLSLADHVQCLLNFEMVGLGGVNLLIISHTTHTLWSGDATRFCRCKIGSSCSCQAMVHASPPVPFRIHDGPGSVPSLGDHKLRPP